MGITNSSEITYSAFLSAVESGDIQFGVWDIESVEFDLQKYAELYVFTKDKDGSMWYEDNLQSCNDLNRDAWVRGIATALYMNNRLTKPQLATEQQFNDAAGLFAVACRKYKNEQS